jgi:DNA-3-methyladenine glycosylase II
MIKPPPAHSATPEAAVAQAFFEALDDPIAALALAYGPVDFTIPSHGLSLPDPLERLALSIVGQVISVKAALAVFARLRELLGGHVDAGGLAAANAGALRSIGLSTAKARALQELGAAVAAGRLSFEELRYLSDEHAQARLLALRGVGTWSAQMFLLRSLARPDVFPAGDLGLRRGIEALYHLDRLPTIAEASTRALAWRPYRSYAAKYLWLHYTAVSET